MAQLDPCLVVPAEVRHIEPSQLLASTQPTKWLNARLGALLRVQVGTSTVESLPDSDTENGPKHRGAAPAIPVALASALAQFAPEWLLPGLQHMPTESLALLQADRRFVAALMVGANHEMVRELLWRGFPLTSPAVTVLDRFWPSGQPSISPIGGWPEKPLGAGIAPAATPLVMALRGELIQRFPDTLVYAVPALDTGRPNWSKAVFPDFHGRLAADLSYFGFNGMQVDGLLDDKGWFIVLQQQPTASRFGVDEPGAHQGTHLKPERLNAPDGAADREQPNAAKVAADLAQRTFRLAIHASQLLDQTVAN